MSAPPTFTSPVEAGCRSASASATLAHVQTCTGHKAGVLVLTGRSILWGEVTKTPGKVLSGNTKYLLDKVV